MSKRKAEEAVANLSELQSPAKNVRLEGMMTRLSPMKRSGKTSKSLYFDGELSEAMRVYGYDSKVREKLEDRACQKEGVRLIGVDITKSRVGEECEIYLKSDAYISGCKSLFDVDCDMGGSKQSKAVELRDVKDMKAGTMVDVKGKVLKVEEAMKVGKNGKQMQKAIVSDGSGWEVLTVWENQVGTLVLGKSYNFTCLRVNSFDGKNSLTTVKGIGSSEEIDDLAEVVGECQVEELITEVRRKVANGRVKGVVHLDHFYACFWCQSKVAIDINDADFGVCTKCKAFQCVAECSVLKAAKIIVESEAGLDHLRAFGSVLDAIVDGLEVSAKALLMSKRFSFLESNGVIQSVSRSES